MPDLNRPSVLSCAYFHIFRQNNLTTKSSSLLIPTSPCDHCATLLYFVFLVSLHVNSQSIVLKLRYFTSRCMYFQSMSLNVYSQSTFLYVYFQSTSLYVLSQSISFLAFLLPAVLWPLILGLPCEVQRDAYVEIMSVRRAWPGVLIGDSSV